MWDYGLLDSHGSLVGLPFHYRDKRTDGIINAVYDRISRDAVYKRTGLQTISINTLFQLAAAVQNNPRSFDAADILLLMPDLLHFYLTGARQSEFTIASTTQLYDTVTGNWATEIAEAIGFPARLFPPVVADGTRYGNLLPQFGAGRYSGDCAGGTRYGVCGCRRACRRHGVGVFVVGNVVTSWRGNRYARFARMPPFAPT